MKAVGLVTNIESRSQLEQLKKGLDIPLYPLDIDELAAYLKVSHYPFVFDGEKLWQ